MKKYENLPRTTFLFDIRLKTAQIPLLTDLGETRTRTGLQISTMKASSGNPLHRFSAVGTSGSVTSSTRLISTCEDSVQTWCETKTLVRSRWPQLLDGESSTTSGENSLKTFRCDGWGMLNCVCWSGYLTRTLKYSQLTSPRISASIGTPKTNPARNLSGLSDSPVGSKISACSFSA